MQFNAETLWHFAQLCYPIYLEAAILHVNANLIELKNLKQCSRTSSLWFQYMRIVDILKLFIQAETTGDCKIHLVVHEMLPCFAAAGHNLYTESVYSSKCYPYQLITLTFILCLFKGAMLYVKVTDTGQVCQQVS